MNSTDLVVAEKQHSEFSMSGFSRTVACPAWHSLAKLAPPPPDHPAGIEGTEAHIVFETFLKNPKKPYIIKSFLGNTYPEEMVQHGMESAQKIWDLRDSIDPSATVMSEIKLDTSPFTAPGNFGTTDCLIVSPKTKTLVVADYKYGVMPVEVAGNWQLIGYALAASHMFKHIFKYIHSAVIQPRGRTKAPKMRAHITTLTELRSWEPKFLKAVARTKVKNPVVNPGSHCYFCPAREHTCPAYMEKNAARARDAFANTEAGDWLEAFLKPRSARVK